MELKQMFPGTNLLRRNPIRAPWDRLSNLPYGKKMFSRLVGVMVPYTGSVSPFVEDIRPGYARVRLHDARAVRNHLRSIHAIAIANIAELAGSLALLYTLPDDARMIVKGLEIQYLKKARGIVTAEGDCAVVTSCEKRAGEANVIVTNESAEIVAKMRVEWLVGPQA